MCDLKTFRTCDRGVAQHSWASSATNEAAEGTAGHDKDEENGVGASQGNEFEVLSMVASCPMTPPESHF
jgi:hypothetical protein